MGNIEINFTGAAEDVIKDIQGKISELSGKMEELIVRAANVFEDEAKYEAPVLFGNLQNSISTENVDLFTRLITPHVDYAIYVHDGHMTRPRTIDTGSYGGKMSYGGAQHFVPGNPFMDRAQATGESYVESLVDEFLGWLSE